MNVDEIVAFQIGFEKAFGPCGFFQSRMYESRFDGRVLFVCWVYMPGRAPKFEWWKDAAGEIHKEPDRSIGQDPAEFDLVDWQVIPFDAETYGLPRDACAPFKDKYENVVRFDSDDYAEFKRQAMEDFTGRS